MAQIQVNDVSIYYEETGEGPETIVFSHSYLLSGEHFRPQVERLSERYRCIAFDHRGHGRSEKPRSGYELDNLYADAVGLIEGLALAPCHFVGLSTGGFIGQRIALRRPELLQSLVLMDTSADAEPAVSKWKYRLMIFAARRIGLWSVAGQAMRALFSRKFLRDPNHREEVERHRKILLANETDAVARFGLGIFARSSVYEELPGIETPTLVIVGERDQPTPVARATRIASQIPGAELRIIPNAGHICTVEEPAAVNEALETFFRLHSAQAR